MKIPLLVFSDLDGTLLDHYSYSHAAAAATLQQLAARAIPLIPCSSKTAAEILQLRQELNNTHPFIAENGAAVYIPRDYFRRPPAGSPPAGAVLPGFICQNFSPPRAHWLDLLTEAKQRFGSSCFTHFDEMGIDGIAAATGLSPQQAQLANTRQFSEPILWQGDAAKRQAFIEFLQDRNGVLLQGGRFLHLSGHCDKGSALRWLSAQYRRQPGSSALQTIAAGDSGNDCAMLEAADWALCVRSPAHPPPAVTNPRQYLSKHSGPRGFAEGISHILAQASPHDNTATEKPHG